MVLLAPPPRPPLAGTGYSNVPLEKRDSIWRPPTDNNRKARGYIHALFNYKKYVPPVTRQRGEKNPQGGRTREKNPGDQRAVGERSDLLPLLLSGSWTSIYSYAHLPRYRPSSLPVSLTHSAACWQRICVIYLCTRQQRRFGSVRFAKRKEEGTLLCWAGLLLLRPLSTAAVRPFFSSSVGPHQFGRKQLLSPRASQPRQQESEPAPRRRKVSIKSLVLCDHHRGLLVYWY